MRQRYTIRKENLRKFCRPALRPVVVRPALPPVAVSLLVRCYLVCFVPRRVFVFYWQTIIRHRHIADYNYNHLLHQDQTKNCIQFMLEINCCYLVKYIV